MQPDEPIKMPAEQFDPLAASLDQPDEAPTVAGAAARPRRFQRAETAEQATRRREREARYITDLRLPKEPFGIAIGAIRTGHNDGEEHPAWCASDECTAGDPNFPHHLSAWTIVYPDHRGEAAILVRLYADIADPADEPPTVEVVLMRPGQCSSLEGYELRGSQAALLAETLGAHGQVAVASDHWQRGVPS